MVADPNYLVWLDLETTGTEERDDPILEIGMVVTDPYRLETRAEFSAVALPIKKAQDRLEANEFVRDMHAKSGLWADCLQNGRALDMIEARAMQFLADWGKRHEFRLAGSGVAHFDRRFLKAQMSELDRWFQYPVLDVGVIRRSLELWAPRLVPEINEGKNHRALDDARTHLEEGRYYRDLFREWEGR